MSLLKSRIKRDEEEKIEIQEKIASENIVPTEVEQETADNLTKVISDRFAEQMIGKNIEDLKDDIERAVKEECARLPFNFETQKRIEKTVLMKVLGNGPIDVYLKDPDVTEIVIQRYDNIVIEKKGKIQKSDVQFYSEEHLMTIIKRIVHKCGRKIDITSPIVDCRLEDGSRVNATHTVVSPDGATMTIRKFNNKVLSPADYNRYGTLAKPMLIFLMACVQGKVSMFVSGGTGTGKTTLLNMLSSFIPEDELIITIEDTLELKLQQPNVRRMEVRLSTNKDMMNVDQKMLVKAALRQRPDRIILGETRDGSIVDLISAMSTGHEGSMSTIHANDPRNMCDVRIPMLYTMNSDANFTERSIAMQVSEAIHLIVQIKRFPDGSRKVTHITEVSGLDENMKIITNDIFYYDEIDKKFYSTGYYPKRIIDEIISHGVRFKPSVLNGLPRKEETKQEEEC